MNWNARDRVPFGQLAAIRAGSGEPVIFLHGVGLRAEAWGAQIDKIAREFSVTAPDVPGHGESECLEIGARLSDFTDQIAAAISAPAYVVGHSLGAMIAMDLAVRYPEKVRGVAALNAIFQRDAAARGAVNSRAKKLGDIANPDPEPTLRRWFGDRMSAERHACRNWLGSVSPQGYRAAYSVFAAENGPSETALSAFACPALFMTGDTDPNSTPAMSRAMANLAADGHAHIVEGAAHMMPMTHADAVNTALLSFFGDVSR